MTATTEPTEQPVRTEPSMLQRDANARPRRPWLAAYAALLALATWAGAAGLAVAFSRVPEEPEGRVPFVDPVLGGLALALLVGVPASIVTVMAWRGHPTRQLSIWRPPVAYALLAFAALGYAVVALLLALADARAMPQPYLRIDADAYFTWGTLFYAPTIIAAWLLASDVVWLLATAARGRPDFRAVLTAMAGAVGVATLGTLVPDLVTSPLRAVGVIEEAAWEASITEHTGWFVFTWVTLIAYLLLFLVAFPLAVRHSTRLRGAAAVVTGVVAFIVFQCVEYLIVR